MKINVDIDVSDIDYKLSRHQYDVARIRDEIDETISELQM